VTSADGTGPREEPHPDAHMHLAQVNVSRLTAPLLSPRLSGFVAAAGPIEAEAARAPGFVWRTMAEVGPGPAGRPFTADVGSAPGVMVNLSVWTSLEDLERFVLTGRHRDALRRRRSWFEPLGQASAALWWVPVGHRPSLAEAEARLRHLRANGPTPWAFTAGHPFPAPAPEGTDAVVDLPVREPQP
jgi:hypothetical protein